MKHIGLLVILVVSIAIDSDPIVYQVLHRVPLPPDEKLVSRAKDLRSGIQEDEERLKELRSQRERP